MSFNDNVRIDTSKVQRRSGGRGGGRRGVAIGGGGLLVVVVLAIASQLLGIDLTPLSGLAGGAPGGTGNEQVVSMGDCQTGADANADDNCRMAAASDSIDRYWESQVGNYRAPGVILYTGATSSPCGTASNAVGPFYCPSDESIYVDTEFFEILRQDFEAQGGPLAQMYVLAHEWGHHISKLIGSFELTGQGSGASSGSVRLELQADCFAGAWVKNASTVADDSGVPFLKPVTEAQLADALDAAATVGDDHIMQQSGQGVNPDAFTHGSSEQRQRWFTTGYRDGPTACGTFDVPAGSL